MPSRRRRMLRAIVLAIVLPVGGCLSDASQDLQESEPSVKLTVENEDTETHVVDAYIRADNETFDNLDTVRLDANSSFSFSGARYRRDSYTIGVETREASLTHEWDPQNRGEHLSLDVSIGADGRLHEDVECVG